MLKNGKALFCGATYPAEDTGTSQGSEQAIRIISESFLKRPSTSDEAMSVIFGFANEGIYIMQEPGKLFGTYGAMLFTVQGMARICTAGNSFGYHFRDGVLEHCFHAEVSKAIGADIRQKFAFSPEFEIKSGTNSFFLCSACNGEAVENILPDEKTAVQMTEQALFELVEKATQEFSCSAAAIILPERQRMFFK